MQRLLLLISILLMAGGAAEAGGFSTGFGVDYAHNTEVAGQNGWTIDDSTPDLSFFVRLNGSDAAALGGYYDSPAGRSVKLSHHVGIPLSGANFRCMAAVLPSTAEYPSRDAFGWTLADPAGNSLFSLRFVPAANDPLLLNITWSSGTNAPVSTGWAISYSAPYIFDLKFSSAGALNLGFTAKVSGSTSFSFNGMIPGVAGKMLDTASVDYAAVGAEFGDNFVVVDDLVAVTMPIIDADDDGFSVEMEEWFGTSDIDAGDTPTPTLSVTAGAIFLGFPSVLNRDYLIESSEDLTSWTAISFTAIATTSSWEDPVSASGRRFFRIRKP